MFCLPFFFSLFFITTFYMTMEKQMNHRDEFDNSSLNHSNKEKSENVKRVVVQPGNGLSGFVQNPYVFLTAVFASIGGILFGCTYFSFIKKNHV